MVSDTQVFSDRLVVGHRARDAVSVTLGHRHVYWRQRNIRQRPSGYIHTHTLRERKRHRRKEVQAESKRWWRTKYTGVSSWREMRRKLRPVLAGARPRMMRLHVGRRRDSDLGYRSMYRVTRKILLHLPVVSLHLLVKAA